jgi:hypothetical protein
MGTRVIDTASGEVLASATGAYWTDAVGASVDNGAKQDRADRLIMRAKQSGDSISKLTRRLDGMRAEHAKILAQLAANLPSGMAVEFMAQSEPSRLAGDPAVPARLVPVETAESAPVEQAPEVPTDSVSVPNKFDAIALAEAAK